MDKSISVPTRSLSPEAAALADLVEAIHRLGGWRTTFLRPETMTASKFITRLSYPPVKHRIFLTTMNGERYGTIKAVDEELVYLVPEVMDALALVREWQQAERPANPGRGQDGATAHE